jgi:hypothetical protein
LIHRFGGIDFQQGAAGSAVLGIIGFGAALMLLKFQTRVSATRGDVVWRLGLLFLSASYRRIPFQRVKSFVVKYRPPETYTTNNQVRTRPAMWDVMLRFRTKADPTKIEERGVAMFSEQKKDAANQCAKTLNRIVDLHRSHSQSV